MNLIDAATLPTLEATKEIKECQILSSLSGKGDSNRDFCTKYMVFPLHLSIKCNKMPAITQMGKMQKILYQRSEVKSFLFFLHLALSPQGILTCIGLRLWVPEGVPWVQVEVCSAYVSFPLSQRNFSDYVEAGGGSSYRDPPLPFNLLL